MIEGVVRLGAGPPDRTLLEAIAEPAEIVRDDESGCAALFDGRLVETDAVSGAAHVLTAYLEWGADLARRLHGDFAFALWDERRRMLLLSRDRLGVRPLYFRVDGERVIFASRLEQLLRDPQTPRNVDEETCALYLYGQLVRAPARSFFRGVNVVRPGHTVTIERGAVAERRYWRSPASPPAHGEAGPEVAAEYRALLTQAVTSRLADNEVAALPLSGGLDSASLASVATAAGKSVRAYSWIFERFREIDERSYSVAVTRRHRIPHTLIPADDFGTLDNFADWLPVFTEPRFGPFDDALTRVLRRARADGTSVFLTTLGADELVTGSPAYLADWAMAGRWREVHAEVSAGANGSARRYVRRAGRGLVVPLLPYRLQLRLLARGADVARRWLPSHLRDLIAGHASRAVSGRHAWWHQLRDALTSETRSYAYASVDRLAALYGHEARHPFADVRLVEFALRAPPDVFFHHGQTKAVVRAALRDIVPSVVLDRTDKPNVAPLAAQGLRVRHVGLVRALLQDSELERRRLVVPGRWSQDVERYLGRSGDLPAAIWLSITLELWLRAQSGRLPPVLGTPRRPRGRLSRPPAP